MPDEPKIESAEPCTKCGQPMEQVHLGAGAEGLIVYHGPPPEGMLANLAEVFTGSLVRTESGAPVLLGIRENYKFPGKHCKHCRQITLSYRP